MIDQPLSLSLSLEYTIGCCHNSRMLQQSGKYYYRSYTILIIDTQNAVLVTTTRGMKDVIELDDTVNY